jgi:hypothetical protein
MAFCMNSEIFKQRSELLKGIHEFVVKSCKVIFWHDGCAPAPKPLRGGCCFVLRFRNKLVGITADHVVQAYRREKARLPTLVGQLWNIAFDLSERIIDHDTALDIATFDVSEWELSQIGGNEFDCRGSWPPPNPQVGNIISIAGFPELERQFYANRAANFSSYVGMTVIDDINDREILTTYDPNRDHDLSGVVGLPPLGLNLSGCSGGPVLAHGDQNGVYRWNVVGLIVSGPGDSEGETSQFDLIRIRRIHFIREDGTLNKPDQGWLPPRTYVDPR